MTVYDVDAHFEPFDAWLEGDADLARRMDAALGGRLVVGDLTRDLVADLPASEQPSPEDVLLPGMAIIRDYDAKPGNVHPTDAAARVAWMDEQGIDLQHVHVLDGVMFAEVCDDAGLSREVIERVNTWSVRQIDGHGDRLFPVAGVEFSDLDLAVAEMRRMHALGARAFHVPSHPVAGYPPAHVAWDPVWATATELGMLGVVHVGQTPMRYDPGWARMVDADAMRMFATMSSHQAAELLLASMAFNGTFARHPNLTLMLFEVGIAWMPYFLDNLDGKADAPLFLGEWKYDQRPSDFVRSQVLISPMPNPAPIQDPMRFVEAVGPEMLVFSSDVPHLEGSPDAVGHYDGAFGGRLSSAERAWFDGGAVVAAYARMSRDVVATRSE